jgi:hypothetical protein
MRATRPKRPPCQYPGCSVKEAHYSTRGGVKTCGRHAGCHVIKLTPQQAEWVDWALTGPIDEWGYPADLAHSHDIPEAEAELAILTRDGSLLEGTTLFIPAWATIDSVFVDDLLNMLEDVAPDVEDGAGREEYSRCHPPEVADLIASRKARCARNAAARIREAFHQD